MLTPPPRNRAGRWGTLLLSLTMSTKFIPACIQLSCPRILPMTTLQQLYDLDRSSPQFHEQLSDLIHGQEYQNSVLNLKSNDLTWLVEYLDSVSHQVTLTRIYTVCQCRFLPLFWIPQTTCSRNSCMNSKRYVVPKRFYWNCARFQTLS